MAVISQGFLLHLSRFLGSRGTAAGDAYATGAMAPEIHAWTGESGVRQ
jgi:hypothetical protein